MFVEIQLLNTIDTEVQYVGNVITGCCAQKYSVYFDAIIKYNWHRNAVFFVVSSLDVVHRNTEFIVMQ